MYTNKKESLLGAFNLVCRRGQRASDAEIDFYTTTLSELGVDAADQVIADVTAGEPSTWQKSLQAYSESSRYTKKDALKLAAFAQELGLNIPFNVI